MSFYHLIEIANQNQYSIEIEGRKTDYKIENRGQGDKALFRWEELQSQG
jgi:hypothetical protein